MMKNLMMIFLFLNVWLPNRGHAQDITLLQRKFDNYLQNHFQEKLYVHTDKSSYLAGEIIWFRIYNVEAYTNQPVSVSKVAYVEILDAENKPVLQTKVELEKDGGEGSLYVPVSLPSGGYVMRCYTNWMKNFSPDYYFHHNLLIYNTLSNVPAQPKIQENHSYSIQFFPEGGNLVSGLRSKIAFKAVDERGKSFSFSAAVLNHQKDTLVKFSSQNLGPGIFSFVPQNEEEYHVWIQPATGLPFSVSLPRVFKRGAVLNVERENEELSVAVQNNLENQDELVLFVHSGQRVVFHEKLNTNQPLKKIKIPLAVLGEGISNITLFDSDGNPLCERLCFKKPEKILKSHLSLNQQNYSSREKVELQVHQTNDKGEPVKANFSVSVCSLDSLGFAEDDITSYLWLNSELRGKIANANWYLHDASPKEVDLLMLTQGWRRFKWEDVLQKKQQTFEYLPEIEGPIVSGRIYDVRSNAASKNSIGYLSVPEVHHSFYTSSSDEKGKINFYTRNYFGGNELIALPGFQDSLSRIEIYSPYSNHFAKTFPVIFNKSPDTDDLLKRSVAMQVNNAFFSKKLNNEVVSVEDTSAFYHYPDKVYKLDDYIRFTTMEEVLREYVPEVMVSLRKKDYHLRVFDTKMNEFSEKPPLILIDGVPVSDDGNTIIKTDPKKIQRLEIISGDYLFGKNMFPGILSFYSYKDDLAGYQLPQQSYVIDYEGLQKKREFYSPMYEGDVEIQSRLPDYRTTLFWSARNQTDKQGSAKLEFFTADTEGKYLVTVQALTENGETGVATALFTVTKNNSIQSNYSPTFNTK